MKEKDVCSQLVDYLKKNVPCVVFKHADRATIGMPDLSVTAFGKTHWFEIKFVKLPTSRDVVHPRDFKLSRLQLEIYARLELHGEADLCVFVRRGHAWWLLTPSSESVKVQTVTYGGWDLGEHSACDSLTECFSWFIRRLRG